MDLTQTVVDQLEEARRSTLGILEPFDDADLTRQVSPLMSPLVWDLAHIGHFEELWLLRALGAGAPTDPRYDDLYDAFAHPRRERAGLPILGPDAARAFVADVRARVLEHLAQHGLDAARHDGGDPLLADGFVYGMVIQHEHQHDETLLATIDLMEDVAYPFGEWVPARPAPVAADGAGSVLVDGGDATLGTDSEPWAYDNERPAHTVALAPFHIDVAPVSNAAFRAFIEAGGYADARLWTEAGWSWRQEAELEHPHGWHREGEGSWSRLRFGHREDLPGDEPVEHVCWYEADAYARWADARLPAEPEWEHAARSGVLESVGAVWEWTSTDFGPYPGFRAFPYPEYSEVFFGDEYQVLRGGSWATHPAVERTTFRNWDYPIRRQIFSGFRCARDAR
jgi:gamma-glutamyl hercynylcysteine S-oxide synthase